MAARPSPISDRRGPRLPRNRAQRVVLWLVGLPSALLLVAGFAAGPATGLVVTGLLLLLAGAGAAVIGSARWVFIASRRVGALVALAGVAALVTGGIATPPSEPTAASPAARPASPPAASAPASRRSAAAQESAVASTEAALAAAEFAGPAAAASTAPPTGSLDDGAADRAASGAAQARPASALAALAAVPVKGRAPMTGYSREAFGRAWADTDHNGCDTRNDVLARDLEDATVKGGTRGCVVLSGTLAEPYTPGTVAFRRGQRTSELVQIDHVVPLGDAWQTGAQQWDTDRRTALANDRLNLLAVDGRLNEAKGDGDAATWLPPNKGFRCAYVARQVAVKVRYGLWMTRAEKDASATVLSACPDEPLPGGVAAALPAPAPSASRTTTAAAPAPPAPVVPAPRAAPSTSAPARVAPPPAPAPAAPAPAPASPAPAAPPAPGAVSYRNCDDVRAHGAAPIHPGDPGWQPKFDRDGDGTGCDT